MEPLTLAPSGGAGNAISLHGTESRVETEVEAAASWLTAARGKWVITGLSDVDWLGPLVQVS